MSDPAYRLKQLRDSAQLNRDEARNGIIGWDYNKAIAYALLAIENQIERLVIIITNK